MNLEVKALLAAVVIGASVLGAWWFNNVLDERAALKTQVADLTETVRFTKHVSATTSRVMSARVQAKQGIQERAKDVQVEIAKLPDEPTACYLPGPWRLLHDAAAEDRDADTSGGADAPAVPAKAALATVTENYAISHDNADRLLKLQEWVRSVTGDK